jgi:hypothetical protein
MENKVLEAFKAGKKIKHKSWVNDEWIMKIAHNQTMSQYSIHRAEEPIENYPELFEIVEEHKPEELQTEIQKAIKLLIENNYEVYFITKTQIVV